MEKKDIKFLSGDKNMTDLVNFIFDNAEGTVIELTAAPTTAGAELKPNQSGIYSTTLYKNINGTIYSISLTAV